MHAKRIFIATLLVSTLPTLVFAMPAWLNTLLGINEPEAFQATQDPEAQRLARAVQATFKANCFYCHGEPGKKVRGGFDSVLDFDKLRSDPDFINLNDPAQSPIYQVIESDEMPKVKFLSKVELTTTQIRKLTQEEKGTVLAWIKAGAPSVVGEKKNQVLQDAGTASYSYLIGAIAKDLERLPEHKRTDIRYLSLAHMPPAGDSAEDVELFRDALTKLVNSLSQQEELFPLQAIDANRLIFRVDIGALGWSAQIWDQVASRHPYLISAFDDVTRSTQSQTGTQFPYMRGDWFAFDASKPPFYYEFLQIPTTDTALEKKIDVDKDIKARRILRAAFSDSGVSQNNRMIERHKTRVGAYWKSYDFAESTGTSDLFSRPLGPGDGAAQFKHAGGEIIWNLPNGLQAYMLVNSNHQRLDTAPTEIVQDTSRRNAVIVNGISCMSCHNQGMQRHSDQLRAYVDKNFELFSQEDLIEIFATYRGNDELTAAFNEDQTRFVNAMKAAGVKHTSPGDPEPVRYLTDRFEKDVDLKRAAAELGISLKDLTEKVQKSPELQAIVSRMDVHGVPRSIFEDVYQQMLGVIQSDAQADDNGNVATDSFRMLFVSIPGGTFQMGSPDTEPGRIADRERLHSVTVDAFEIGETPITQRQWFDVMKGTGLEKPSRFRNKENCPRTFDAILQICPNNPVEQVSWNDSQDFIAKLNQSERRNCGDTKTRKGFDKAAKTPGCYRLPTEAEWEWAARGRNQGSYFFGEDDANHTRLKQVAWFTENSAEGRPDIQTHEVEEHRGKTNAFGLTDVHGNVWQWVQDNVDDNYGLSEKQLTRTVRNPQGPSTDSNRVVRGGSWRIIASNLRSANRYDEGADIRSDSVGLRLVRTR